jgi:UDP-galactopyranose mutase
MDQYDVVVIGAGLSGCTIAERFANVLNKKVLIVEKRDHIGGNCYDYIDDETGIRVSKYGPHFFHTNDDGVWDYANKFSEWTRYDLKVMSHIDNRLVPVPVNMETINILNNQSLQTPEDTRDYMHSIQLPCVNPQNSEDIALSRVGRTLYEKMFLPYTQKQWNRHPTELDTSVLSRIPIRYDSDARYFTDKYQAIPKYGYTAFFERLIDHPNITIRLNVDTQFPLQHKCVIYTGPIDHYFKSNSLPQLEYRSLRFENERYFNTNYSQQNIVINYPNNNVSHTRIVEYKHLPYTEHANTPHTIVVKEYPSDIGEPYYPVPSQKNKELYEMYKLLSTTYPNVHMLGRLANYKYFNMDQAIRNALDYFDVNFRVDTYHKT